MKYLEKHLHEKYSNKRLSGEWFSLTEQDLMWLKNKYSKSLVELLENCLDEN